MERASIVVLVFMKTSVMTATGNRWSSMNVYTMILQVLLQNLLTRMQHLHGHNSVGLRLNYRDPVDALEFAQKGLFGSKLIFLPGTKLGGRKRCNYLYQHCKGLTNNCQTLYDLLSNTIQLQRKT